MSEETKSVDLETIYAIKAGMTRIFDENGKHVPVTVVKLVPNVISQVKTPEKDGYSAYQVAYYEKREKLVNNPKKGHLKKANIDKMFARFSEVKTDVDPELLGKEVTYGSFTAKSYVDVSGISKGKGFQGVMKRHNFQGGPAAHGSKFHRTTGSIGNRATPGRVFAEKKMPGHMGAKKKTIQNLEIIDINLEKNFMLIKGSVPGAKNSFIKISKAIKK
jgi:large subunit ribosomal protein L3